MNIYAELRAGVTTESADATRALAARLAAELPADSALALHGDLGAGKTTFVQGLARGLGITATVTSPTFAIYSVYRGAKNLWHLDAYRLENERRIEARWLVEFLVSPWILAAEWPEKIAGWLPPGALHLHLSIDEAGNHRLRLD